MTETVSGVLTVEGVVESTQRGESRQGQFGEYCPFNFIVEGINLSTTVSADKDDPLSEGEYIRVDYKSKVIGNKIFNNSLNIKHLSEETTTKQQGTKKATTIKTSTGSVTNVKAKVAQVTQQTTTKDISMEVSGLLQAIINKHGLTDSTEAQLREALQLKRRIAGELEQNGTV